MSFNNLLFKFSLFVCVLVISACASKQTSIVNPELEAERLKAQTELERFQTAIKIIQTKGEDSSSLVKAKLIFDDLYKQNSLYLGALINLADVSLKLKEIDTAKDQYTEALAQLNKPQLLKAEEANASVVASVVENKPSDNANRFKVHVFNQLGLIERRQGKFDEAEAYYRQALEIESDNAITLKNLAILLDLYRGQLAEAYELYLQYQKVVGNADPKVKDWLYDLKNRLPAEEVSDE